MMMKEHSIDYGQFKVKKFVEHINHTLNFVNIAISLLPGLIKMDLIAIILSILYIIILVANKN